MKISIFSSGSCGNSTLVMCESKNILIDAGISRKQIELGVARSGLALENIDILLITHEHTDHIKSLPSLLKKYNMITYMTEGTFTGCINIYPAYKEFFECKRNAGQIQIIKKIDMQIAYQSIEFDDVTIKVIPTFHDAIEPVGFIINGENKKLVYITDTGYVHTNFQKDINNAEAYVLESNHDPEILMLSNRPYQTKKRILSDHGHLSNEDSMVTLAQAIGDKTKIVFHAHISQECNLESIVEMTRKKVLDDYGIDYSDVKFVITSPRPTGEFEL